MSSTDLYAIAKQSLKRPHEVDVEIGPLDSIQFQPKPSSIHIVRRQTDAK